MDASAIEISSRDVVSALGFKIAFEIRGATPEAVFDYVSDPERVPIWQSDALDQRQITQGPMRVGTLLDNRKRFLGYRFSTVTEVITHDRPTDFEFQSNGRQKYTFTYHFTSSAEGTSVGVDAEFPRLRGVFVLIPRRFLRRAITSELRGNHLTLKRILETRTEAPD
jgi:hypothetical protein